MHVKLVLKSSLLNCRILETILIKLINGKIKIYILVCDGILVID